MAAAIVYLNTKKHIGRTLELQDVYPIQAYDTELKVVSKNRIKYNANIDNTINGLEISINNDNVIEVTGSTSTTSTIDEYIAVGSVEKITPGKYTISVTNSGVDIDNKKCYITYTLKNGNTELQSYTKLSEDIPVVVDSKELNFNKIEMYLHIEGEGDISFNTSASQTFGVQVEYGEVATDYTSPKDESNIGGITINIYGKNLYSGSSIISTGSDIVVNDVSITDATTSGIHYVKGVMNVNNNITINTGSDDQIINTPLLNGDKFTFIYTYNSGELLNPQVVYGHVDYVEYEPYKKAQTVPGSNGVCDISNIKCPYSFLALDDNDSGYAIYLSYDPALSRNWVERQLKELNNKMDLVMSALQEYTKINNGEK